MLLFLLTAAVVVVVVVIPVGLCGLSQLCLYVLAAVVLVVATVVAVAGADHNGPFQRRNKACVGGREEGRRKLWVEGALHNSNKGGQNQHLQPIHPATKSATMVMVMMMAVSTTLCSTARHQRRVQAMTTVFTTLCLAVCLRACCVRACCVRACVCACVVPLHPARLVKFACLLGDRRLLAICAPRGTN